MSSIGYFHQLCSFWSDDLLGPLKNMFCSRCGNGNEQWSYFRWWRFWIFPGDLHQLVDIRHRLGILDRRWRLVSMKLLNVGNPLLNHLYFRLYKIKMEAEASIELFLKKTFAWAAVSFTLFTRLPARLVFLLTDLNWNWENIKPVTEQIQKKEIDPKTDLEVKNGRIGLQSSRFVEDSQAQGFVVVLATQHLWIVSKLSQSTYVK